MRLVQQGASACAFLSAGGLGGAELRGRWRLDRPGGCDGVRDRWRWRIGVRREQVRMESQTSWKKYNRRDVPEQHGPTMMKLKSCRAEANGCPFFHRTHSVRLTVAHVQAYYND